MAVNADEVYPFRPGYLESPPDERDYPVDELYAAMGVAKPEYAALPPSYRVSNLPVVLNQGLTPMCVAYASSAMKDWQDYPDSNPDKHWNFDEPSFFRAIGGTSNGAVPRNALDRLLKVGYPVVNNASPVGSHRIAGYYAVPVTKYDIMAAIYSLGVLLAAGTWYNSWCTYRPVNDTLARPDYGIGGHATAWIGYNATGIILQNSWGTSFAGDGRVTMPWAYALRIREIWKTKDR